MFKKSKQHLQAGLSIQKDTVSVAMVKSHQGKPPELVDFACLQISEAMEITASINKLSKQFRLSKAPCIVAMEPGSYSLLQIESPNVNADEMRSAIKWKVKDLVDFHIDDATIDLFDLPASSRNGASQMMHVVVARTSLIQERVGILHGAGIEPLAIDITELALRNIARTEMNAEDEPSAFMHLLPDNIYIEIGNQESLFLSRNIEANIERLSAPSDDQFSNWNDASDYEMLILEIQRSMDYYESHYGNGPTAEMRIYQRPGGDDAFIDFSREQLACKVVTTSLNDTISGVENIDEKSLPACLPAIGAALRAA